ncbi:VOC family protein [Myroides sp. JBRI-B21084]|uniref:VOC family protein n=1 Tax=Myroides sp. JBRI-B21084 TaxID=3119977 RepID=UPI0026E1BE33|nr:VOC family protein [Paenimyroides cloacae]WKW47507.1 VOC family protein [Paenimyroides cloacae]
MNKAQIIASAPRLYVENVEKTLIFYIEKLGFSLINKIPNTYGMVERNGFQIHFAVFNNHFPNKNQKQHIILWIPEIELFFNEIQQKNITILEPITLRIYGNKEFVFADNNGNIITICD